MRARRVLQLPERGLQPGRQHGVWRQRAVLQRGRHPPHLQAAGHRPPQLPARRHLSHPLLSPPSPSPPLCLSFSPPPSPLLPSYRLLFFFCISFSFLFFSLFLLFFLFFFFFFFF